MATMRFLRRAERYFVGDIEVDGLDDSSLVAPIELMQNVTVVSVWRAFQNRSEYEGVKDWKGATLLVTPDSLDEFSIDYFSDVEHELEFSSRRCRLVVQTGLGPDVIEQERLRDALGPLLTRNKCSDVVVGERWQDYRSWWEVSFAPPTRGKTIGDLYQIGRDVARFMDALDTGDISLGAAQELAKSGRLDLLVGLAESSWLEVKSAPYDLAREAGKIELAQDAARFANAEGPGLLIVGMRTRKSSGTERLAGVCAISMEALNARQHRAVLDRRIYPPIEGLGVEVVGGPKRGQLLIHIPSQPEENKPYLVHGAIAGGRVEGSFISIVRRRGEGSLNVSPSGIHSMIVAGRALLRGGARVQPKRRGRRTRGKE